MMKVTQKQGYRGHQMSESMVIGAFLALSGGFLDAYTYICRGSVFANAQTGNIVLLGVNLASGEMKKALRCMVPIAAFVAGVFIVECVRYHFRNRKIGEGRLVHWRQIIVAAEILILAIVAFLPQSMNDLANWCVSFVCALQVESFRKIRGNTLATTMCTGNLRSATEMMHRYILTGDRMLRRKGLEYYLIIALFMAGAAVGTLASGVFHALAVLICCFLLLAAFLLMFISPGEASEI